MLRLTLTLVLFTPACVVSGPAEGRPVSQDSISLLARADGFFDRREHENAQRLYELAAIAASGEGDQGRYVEAASRVSELRFLAGELGQARDWLDSATERIQREDAAGWRRWLIARGVVEHGEGNTARGLATLEEAYDFALASAAPLRAVQAAQWASVIAPDELKVRWCHRAIDAGRELEQPALQAALWSQLGWLLEERGLYPESLTAFRQARAETDPEDGHAVLVADWTVGHALRLSAQLGEARILMEDVARRAESAYEKARRPNDAEWVGQVQVELAELDVQAGRLPRAIARMELAQQRLLEAGARRLAPDQILRLEARLAELRSLQLSASGGGAGTR